MRWELCSWIWIWKKPIRNLRRQASSPSRRWVETNTRVSHDGQAVRGREVAGEGLAGWLAGWMAGWPITSSSDPPPDHDRHSIDVSQLFRREQKKCCRTSWRCEHEDGFASWSLASMWRHHIFINDRESRLGRRYSRGGAMPTSRWQG